MAIMDPSRWARLVDLFNRAREGTLKERAALFEETGQADPSLLHGLKQMLADDISGDDPLSRGILPAPTGAFTGL